MKVDSTQRIAIAAAAAVLLILAVALPIAGPRPHVPHAATPHKVRVVARITHRRRDPRLSKVHHRLRQRVAAAVPAAVPPTVDGLPVEFPRPTKVTIALAPKSQFVKLTGRDQPVQQDAKRWKCVLDRTTGLVWEKKTQDRGLRDAQNFYSWFDPSKASNGGYAGIPNHGKCRGGIACDTHAYIQAVNRMKLCGYSDWRLPTRAELSTLVDYQGANKANGLVNVQYFPSGTSGWYWSASSDRSNPRDAWFVLYYNGREMMAPKSQAKRIRLVRGPVWEPAPPLVQQASSTVPARHSVAARSVPDAKAMKLLAQSRSTIAID